MTRRAMTRAAFALVAALALGLLGSAAAEPVEPPPEAPDGADYEAEAGDSIEVGTVETSLGASGAPGEKARGRRRVRFSAASFAGDAREGAGDPLAGGAVDSRGRSGRWTIGRLAPSWARGLVVGGAAEPWRGSEPGDRGPLRGRGGEGVRWQSGGALEVLGGRFSGRDVAGVRGSLAGAAAGVIAARSQEPQVSLGLERGELSSELALDGAGRWRAEAGIERTLTPLRLAARVRAGHPAFRPLASAARAGPAQALILQLAFGSGSGSDGPAARAALAGALWRFRPGVPGARAALEFGARMPHHSRLRAGLEEQNGARREDAAPRRWRQGAWAEWRGGSGRLSLLVSGETWGERAFARGAVRSVSAGGVEWSGPAGLRVRVTHCAYRVRRGESLYLPEAESDRLVLRALSGAGERTRLEIQTPIAGGVVRAAASLAVPSRHPPRLQWATSWTRRASFRRSR